jgi:hypothetical protein
MPDVAKTTPAPWERQQGESGKAYLHFVKYREMDPTYRSLRRLATELGRGSDQLFTWSVRWGWRDRVTQWDDYCENLARDAQVARLKHAGEARVDAIVAGLDMIVARFNGRDAIINKETGKIVQEQVKPIDPNRLGAKDIAALGNVLAKMQGMAEEAAGLKKGADDSKTVNIRLSFDQAPIEMGVGHGIIQAAGRRLEPPSPAGELEAGPDTSGNTE